MTRQLDAKREIRELKRRDRLVKGLEFSLAGAIQFQGGVLRGLSIRYGDFDCLLTLKADFEGAWKVSNVSSDTMMNVLLKTISDAEKGRLSWRADKYQPSDT